MTDSKDDKSPSDAAPQKRAGEADKFWFRSDRFFKVETQWYFTTRENLDVGPFVTRKDAVNGLDLFINCVKEQKMSVAYAIEVAKNGEWAVSMFQ
jgi:hypothetical protein